MSIIRSLSVGNGDFFYIKHNSDSFTIIDCCIEEDVREGLVDIIKSDAQGKNIVRFISTHPDDDHIRGLDFLDSELNLRNFYCVKNDVIKAVSTVDFDKYCELRDSEKAFYLYKGCSRKWLNMGDEERSGSGLHILWPNTENVFYKQALISAEKGESPNNISIVLKYSLEKGAKVLWMGDLETEFMENIEDDITLEEVDILFAAHHGRKSGKIPHAWLDILNPKIIIIGEAPAEHLDHYSSYNIIKQNAAHDMVFDCVQGKVHIYVSNKFYSVDFLDDENMPSIYDNYYIGTLNL
jgi:beta-lactamase superfamily II metal-dependent hydrolase